MAKRNFSNFDEQEIIRKYLDLLAVPFDAAAVDIGAGDGKRSSNTYALVLEGRHVVGIEYDSRKVSQLAKAYRRYPNAFACRAKITPGNVTSLVNGFLDGTELGMISLDIDGYDYWVLDEILGSLRPKLVVSEYNEKIPPPIKFVVNYDPDFTLRHHFYGYSISKLQDLLVKHNYVLLEVEYNNVFIAPAELADEMGVMPDQGYREGYSDRGDRRRKFRSNENMEILQTMSADDAVDFLNDFYSGFKGEYEISAR